MLRRPEHTVLANLDIPRKRFKDVYARLSRKVKAVARQRSLIGAGSELVLQVVEAGTVVASPIAGVIVA